MSALHALEEWKWFRFRGRIKRAACHESSFWRSSDSTVAEPDLSPSQAEEILQGLAGVVVYPPERPDQTWSDDAQLPNLEARYRALVEQIPAVVFMAYLDRGIGEAYVSPQIEAALGFSQEEWLEDPVRWYRHIHPDDKQRWSTEAAEMFLTGNPLRSAYRVVSRDGRVNWFETPGLSRRHTGRSHQPSGKVTFRDPRRYLRLRNPIRRCILPLIITPSRKIISGGYRSLASPAEEVVNQLSTGNASFGPRPVPRYTRSAIQ